MHVSVSKYSNLQVQALLLKKISNDDVIESIVMYMYHHYF